MCLRFSPNSIMQNIPILVQMVQEFRKKHGALPTRITVTPMALSLLVLRKTFSPRCEGVPVEARLFDEGEAVPNGPNLGVFLSREGKKAYIRSCDLA